MTTCLPKCSCFMRAWSLWSSSTCDAAAYLCVGLDMATRGAHWMNFKWHLLWFSGSVWKVRRSKAPDMPTMCLEYSQAVDHKFSAALAMCAQAYSYTHEGKVEIRKIYYDWIWHIYWYIWWQAYIPKRSDEIVYKLDIMITPTLEIKDSYVKMY